LLRMIPMVGRLFEWEWYTNVCFGKESARGK